MSTEEIIIKNNEREENGSNFPKLGCVILCLLLAFMTGIVIQIIVSGARHLQELTPYSESTPLDIPEESGTETELNEIRAKIESFKQALNSDSPMPAELPLSVKDVNILISNDNYLSDLRKEYFFQKIKPDGTIIALCSRKMRKFLPWQERKYWNGEMTLNLEVLNGAVFLRVINFKSSNGSSMPENLLEKWRSQDQLEMYKNDELFADSLKKINSVRFADNLIILSTKKISMQAK
ncbi:MAG: hypothetical protein VX646_07965 [Verrucomicrobiota bacterium]|nr:hypothetical protein [Verrucomicrobiota bacterium]MEE2967802.1 hypothetical protein [Verrucomicrobiota bacterium]